MEQTRIALLTECIREMINKEREVAPIITRCHDAIEVAINDVVPEADTEMVVEKHKVHKRNKTIIIFAYSTLNGVHILYKTSLYINLTLFETDRRCASW